MDKIIKEIDFTELGVMARSKMDSLVGENGRNRITLIIEDEENRYAVHISKANARFLIDKLKKAIKLA